MVYIVVEKNLFSKVRKYSLCVNVLGNLVSHILILIVILPKLFFD